MATPTVEVKPVLIRWAIERSGLPREELRKDFRKIDDWLTGDKSPTYRQLEHFARKTMTPFGYLFLDEPPEEELPFPDFRTVGDTPIDRPSPNLIDTIHSMQRRQAWMRDFALEQGQGKLDIVGCGAANPNVTSLAQRMRQQLDLSADWALPLATWEHALTALRTAIENAGVLVFSNSVVGLNNYRSLDPEEFRGFVLIDEYVPLIFINSADSKSAQMFTIAHELAHVWLDIDGLFNLIKTMPSNDDRERFCNRVAAEFLIPAYKLKQCWSEVKTATKPFHAISRRFKVSPIVAARRALDSRLIARPQFFAFYEQMKKEWKTHKAKQKGGGSFYETIDSRLSRRFVNALMTSTREGRTLHREAYSLTDMQGETFNCYADMVIHRMKNERQ